MCVCVCDASLYPRVLVVVVATAFLDAPRISIRGCVRPLVRPSVAPSVRNAFIKIAENGVMQDEDASYVVYTALLQLKFIHFTRYIQNSLISKQI